MTCNNRLEYKVESFTKGMYEACTVRENRAGANRSLVDFYSQIEIPKRIHPVLHGVVVDVGNGTFGELVTQAVLTFPFVDLRIEVGCG